MKFKTKKFWKKIVLEIKNDLGVILLDGVELKSPNGQSLNLPKIISLSLLGNLALFFLKLKFNKDQQSRGILFSTFLYGVVIVILKFL